LNLTLYAKIRNSLVKGNLKRARQETYRWGKSVREETPSHPLKWGQEECYTHIGLLSTHPHIRVNIIDD